MHHRKALRRKTTIYGDDDSEEDSLMTRREGIVIRTHGGHYYVQDDKDTVDCTMRGRMKKNRAPGDLVVIGDRVRWSVTEPGFGIIEETLPRRAVLSRRPPPPRPGRVSEQEQIIVANPDQVLIVFTPRNPPFSPLTLDRYLVACEAVALPVVIIGNKVDLVEQEDDLAPLQVYERAGYRVLYTSVETGEGIEALRGLLRGKLSVLTGPSGVGKSSLLNALWPQLDLNVGEISAYHDRGKHTTVVASLLHPEPDIYVADTPGMRVFLLWDIDPEQLDAFFPEMRPYLGQCHYRPCTHTHEPDCAVIAAVERGDIEALRYESYCKLFAHEF